MSDTSRERPRSLTLIIFSKDRACQLDSLLRSIRDHFHAPSLRITILYRTTTPEFESGYALLTERKIVSGITWRPEKTFQDDVRDIVGGLDDKSLVMFLVDDTVIFRNAVLDQAINAFTDKHLFISLRADRTYPSDATPEFIATGQHLEWKWNYSKQRWVTWNYPFSVDGNIHHARHIKKVLRKISFQAPNSLEGRMHAYRHAWWVKRIKSALAPSEAVLFNNPLNRVQSESETWHINQTAESLNEKYLSKMQIDNSVLYSARPNATHFSVALSFTRIEA